MTEAGKPITVWKRYNAETTYWDHNHIENGHIGTMGDQYLKPVGKFEHQTKNWAKGTWLHEHKYLINGKIIERLS
jgi:hypothetical protein